MTNSDDTPESNFKIQKRHPKTTPPGYQIVFSEEQLQILVQFIESPAFKIFENVLVRQRLDIIARESLTNAITPDDVMFYRGRGTELKHVVKMLKDARKAYVKQAQAEMKAAEAEDKK